MDSLSWFAGGNLILGGMVTANRTLVDYGLSIADTGRAVYRLSASGLAGEYVSWITDCNDHDGSPCDARAALWISSGTFNLRPEVIETWYYAYRATRDPKYRDWAWDAFQAINTYCRTASGFSGLKDVNVLDGERHNDKQESFVFAEVLKYVYLIHLDVSEALLSGAGVVPYR